MHHREIALGAERGAKGSLQAAPGPVWVPGSQERLWRVSGELVPRQRSAQWP